MEKLFNMESLEERYTKEMAKSITVSVEDLTDNEKKLIEKSFELWQEKLDDLKIANDEVKRLSIELANQKAMHEPIRETRDKTRYKDDYDDSTYDPNDLNYK